MAKLGREENIFLGNIIVKSKLDLRKLSMVFQPGITPFVGGNLAEAASVCLDNQQHESGVLLAIGGDFEGKHEVGFDAVTDQMRWAHDDFQEAVELGACGIAILLLNMHTNLSVIRRSRKGTGFDYWMGNMDDEDKGFQDMVRLEVSGILSGTDTDVAARMKKKIIQTQRSDNSGLPAYIVVVEFSSPVAKVSKR